MKSSVPNSHPLWRKLSESRPDPVSPSQWGEPAANKSLVPPGPTKHIACAVQPKAAASYQKREGAP